MNNIFNIKNINKKYIMKLLFIILLLFTSLIVIKKLIIKKPPIKIGLVNTLTGAASTSTIIIRDVAIFMIEEINRKGGIKGHKLELIIKNDKLDPEVALKVDQELIDEGVVAIIGHSFSSLALKVAPLLNDNNIIMICPTVKSTELTGLDDNFLRLTIPLDKDAKATAKIASSNLNLKKMAIVYDLINQDLTKPTTFFLKKEFKSLEGTITADISFNSKENFSARNIARKIIESGSDGVYIITDAIHTALICQHLRINNSQIKIIVHGWAFNDATFISEGGKAIEGVIGTYLTDMRLASEKYKKFEKRFKEKYKSELSGPAQLTYETLGILSDALSKTTDPKKIKNVILQQKEFEAVDGKIRFDKYGDSIRPLHIMEIQNGKMKNIGTILCE